MSRKVKVALYNQLQRFALVDRDATEGAQVGLNLLWPNGDVVKESEIRNTAGSGGGGTTVIPPGTVNPDPGVLPPTSWDAIINIPGDLDSLLGLSTDGIVVYNNTTDTFLTRSIDPEDERITVTDGDGIAGNPTIGLSDWPPVKESVESGETAVIPAGFQLIVDRQFDVVGTLDCQGTLVVL